MKKSLISFYVFLLLISLNSLACVKKNYTNVGDTGSFVYTGYQPLADRPVLVRYYDPGKKDAKVLILMHGNGRGAISYFNSMLPFAKKSNILLIVPEFTAELYPSLDYHRGGVLDKNNKIRPQSEWTFSIIEPLFDEMKKRTGNTSADYMLYGYSAGSQFVHRFLMFVPNNRVSIAVPNAAGTYTMPDFKVDYSYGLANTDLPTTNLVKFFNKSVIIAVGDADTVLSREDLVKTKLANAQGRDRVERARTFFDRSKEMAEKLKTPFNWQLVLVPHLGHAQGPMAKPVAELLFQKNQ